MLSPNLMLAFTEALEKILEAAPRLGTERVDLVGAAGRVLAEDLVAEAPLPAFDYSAMDGYAVRSADFDHAPSWLFSVQGESRAGSPFASLVPGTTCRIFTGAPLPSGADAVVIQEDVVREGERVRFDVRPVPGENIRRAGDDLASGALALPRGTRLGPFQIGLAAALDRRDVLVARAPRVTILCTGDELRAAGSTARPGSIPDSNGPSLAALVSTVGGEARLAPRTGDTLEGLRAAIQAAFAGSDLLLTVGGVSVGDHDLVRDALEAAGAELAFWKVKIKPGKPLVFGHTNHTLVLGLPGNPVSAQLSFALFGMPLLRRMQGDLRTVPERHTATLATAIRQKPGRLGFYRARLSGELAHVFDNQASGSPVSMATADALVLVPADSEGFDGGARVEVIRLAEL